jgi:hypothetical protein
VFVVIDVSSQSRVTDGLIKYFLSLNSRGSSIVVRGFRTDPSQAVIDFFSNKITETPPPDPLFRMGNLNLTYLVSSQLHSPSLPTNRCPRRVFWAFWLEFLPSSVSTWGSAQKWLFSGILGFHMKLLTKFSRSGVRRLPTNPICSIWCTRQLQLTRHSSRTSTSSISSRLYSATACRRALRALQFGE